MLDYRRQSLRSLLPIYNESERNVKFPGYLVTNGEDGVVRIRSTEFDETELTPDSDWMEGYSNTDPSEGVWTGRDLDSALAEVRRRLLA